MVRPIAALAASAGALLAASAVWAAEEGQGSGGMPQLDFSTYASQLFWLFVSFTVLYLVMARIGLPRMASVLEERRLTIDSDLQAAEDAKRHADSVMTTYRDALGEADRKAKAAIAASVERSQNDANAKLAALGAELDKQIDAAQAGIEQAKAGARASVQAIATDVAQDLLAKLGGGITIDRARLEAAVGRSLER
jgi:F-type H+-transporting ATPase subunit b